MPPIPPHIDEKTLAEVIEDLEPGMWTLQVLSGFGPLIAAEGARQFWFKDKRYSIWPTDRR